VTAYVRAAASKSDLERTELAKSKTGVFTGAPPLLLSPLPNTAQSPEIKSISSSV